MASSVSPDVAEGFLLALPLVAIVCMLVDPAPSADAVGGDDSGTENRRASMVLVCVSAAFALLLSVLVHIAGKDGLLLCSGLNTMVLFELVLAVVALGCFHLLRWVAG